MKAEWIHPIEELHGSLTEDYYVREAWGKHIVQRKPRKEMSARKKAVCQAFGEKYGSSRRGKKIADRDKSDKKGNR